MLTADRAERPASVVREARHPGNEAGALVGAGAAGSTDAPQVAAQIASLRAGCRQALGDSPNVTVLCDLDDDVVLVLSGPSWREQTVSSLARRCLDAVRAASVPATAVVGPRVEELEGLRWSYRAAKDTLACEALVGGRRLSSSDPLHADPVHAHGDSQSSAGSPSRGVDAEQLRHIFISRDRQAAAECVDSFIRTLGDSSCATSGRVKGAILEFISVLLETCRTLGCDMGTTSAAASQTLSAVDRMCSRDDLQAHFRHLLWTAMRESSDADARRHPLVSHVLAQIGEHFGDPALCLKTLAHSLGVNPAYLGQLFKRETGKLFSTYLNGMRLNRATELLANSPFKASQVARLAGYQDPNYFYRVFRRREGISVTEFRNRFRAAGCPAEASPSAARIAAAGHGHPPAPPAPGTAGPR